MLKTLESLAYLAVKKTAHVCGCLYQGKLDIFSLDYLSIKSENTVAITLLRTQKMAKVFEKDILTDNI